VLRTELGCQREGLRALVDDDDVGGAEVLEHLDGHVAETARADDHRGGAGYEERERPLDGVVRGEASVGERCGLHRVEIAERDERRELGTIMYGAMPPSSPRPPPAAPISAWCSQ
jgi:hypothetical protein